jgi:hypothetical protein
MIVVLVCDCYNKNMQLMMNTNSPYSNREVASEHLGLLRGLQMLSKQLQHLTSKSC